MLQLVAPEFVGVAIAALLLLVLLPAGARGLARQPALLLALHLVALGALRVIPPGTTLHMGAVLASTFLLLGAIGRGAVVLLLDVLLGRRLRRPLSRIATDLTQGMVWIGIVLVTLPAAGVDPGSILTTSALLTAAIALSLQETLGNLVVGLAIQVQRPFDVGDWILFDGEPTHIGRVLEINWRATKVLTLDVAPHLVQRDDPRLYRRADRPEPCTIKGGSRSRRPEEGKACLCNPMASAASWLASSRQTPWRRSSPAAV